MLQTKIPKFRRCVLQNFPFIEQDFDALTDYELLCKVVEYLNKVIDAQNADAEEIAELETAFNTLKSYVDNYFATLDVQEEINNKLDEMADSGELEEIIAAYIEANVAWCFATVSEMKESENLINGSYARTLGFYSAGDGGAMLYKITNSGTANEMDIIAVGNLLAHACLSDSMNPVMLGAHGNGTSDDTDSVTRTIELAHDINLINKTYSISDTLTIDRSNTKLHDGAITYTKSSGTCIVLDGSISNIEIYNITFVGAATENTNIHCISNPSKDTNNFRNIYIHNNDISEFNLGISVNADLAGDYQNVRISYNKIYNIYGMPSGVGYGIHLANGSATNTNTVVENNDVSQCQRHCIYVARGTGYVVQNNYVHDNASAIVSFQPAVIIARSQDVIFNNNLIKDCNNIMLWLTSELSPEATMRLDSYPCKNVIIENNTFTGASNNLPVLLGYGTASEVIIEDITIRNNRFDNQQQLQIASARNVKIDSNIFNAASGNICIQLHGDSSNTDNVCSTNIYVSNNILNCSVNTLRPIRMNPNFLNHNPVVTFENNVSNTTNVFYAAQAVNTNGILLINQKFSSDFTFASTYAFRPFVVNGSSV